jgi:hypothetical protein
LTSNNQYDVVISSATGVTNATGSYLLAATLSDQSTYNILFSINYEIIVAPPAANITFQAVLSLSGENTNVTKSSFKYNEKAYVSTTLSQSYQLTTTQFLQIKNAYVCCLKNNTAPVFNPSIGKYGCSVYDSVTMDKWIPLVTNKVAGPGTTILSSGNKNSALFSFDVSALTIRTDSVPFL